MHIRIRSGAIAFLLACSVQPAARAYDPVPVDATLQPGQRFKGRIAFEGDEDRVRLELLAGATLAVKVQAVPPASLHPTVEVVRVSDGAIVGGAAALSFANKSQEKIGGIAIDEAGEYDLRIRGSGLGDYVLRTREQLPAHVKAKVHLDALEELSVAFSARAPASAKIVVERVAGAPGAPAAPRLLDADGADVDLDGLVVVDDLAERTTIGPVPLEQDGGYALVLEGPPAGQQTLLVRIDLTQALLAKTSVEESAGHARLEGSLTLADGFWLPDEAGAEWLADELLVRTLPGASPETVAAALGATVIARSERGWIRLRLDAPFSGRVALGPARDRVRDACARARALPAVLGAEPNRLRQAFAVPSDPLWSKQWDMRLAGFERAWDLASGDDQRLVAVVDTGIRFEHPDLAGQVVPGYDFVSDAWNAGDGNGIDADATDVLLSLGTHGTHVAGTIAAVADNAIGIAGGVRDVGILPLRTLGILGGTDWDIAQAVLYAAALPNISNHVPAKRAEVINMSLGGAGDSEVLHEAIRDAADAGCVVVAAAGNAGSKEPLYPAAYPEVIAVAATDMFDHRASYSSYGKHVALAAPGGDPWSDKDHDGEPDAVLSCVVSQDFGAGWAYKAGTSMACPHVAAAAFLLRAVDPTLSPLQVKALLCASADDLGTAGFDKYFGFGRLDAGAAVECLLGIGEGDGAFALPQTLEFPPLTAAQPLALVSRGAPIEVFSATGSAFWLHVAPASGPTPIQADVAVEREGMAPGEYTGTVDLVTSAGPISVPVALTVGQNLGPIGVKTVYVVAKDVADGHIAFVAEVGADDASDLALDPLPEGSYRIFAATDLDFDGIIGEEHDYAAAPLDSSGKPLVFVLKDGETLGGLDLSLLTGAASAWPGGGGLQIVP